MTRTAAAVAMRSIAVVPDYRARGDDMGLGNLNYVAVLVAAIASFVFGGAWYSALSTS